MAGKRGRRPAARTVRRSARGSGRIRAAGAALTLACALAIGWLIGSPDFRLDQQRIEISGLAYTDAAAVRSTIGLAAEDRPNLFRLRTDQMARLLAGLPAVERAEVRAVLPDRLVIEVDERAPVMVVQRDGSGFLVDHEGVVLDALAMGQAPAVALPEIDDQRTGALAPALVVGQTLYEIDLAAMLQLGALTPAAIGSAAISLSVSVDNGDGYVVSAQPAGWRAVFGHYTPNLRPPDIVGRQIQCLVSLLAEGEAEIALIYLAPLDDRCGTYEPRQGPRESAQPSPPA